MLPVEHNDPINAKILAVSEDKIEGFVREPFEEIANRSGVAVEVVMARIAAMLRAGTTGASVELCLQRTSQTAPWWHGKFRKRRSTRRSTGCFSGIHFRVMWCSARPKPSAPDRITNFGRL